MKSLCGLLALCAFALPASAADLGQTDQPIRIALTDQTGARLTAHLAAELLTTAGYSVDLVETDDLSVFSRMERGDIDAHVEIWPAADSEKFKELVREKKLVNLGDLGITLQEGLAYPAHMETTCPGLPALDALRDCAANFATGGDGPVLIDYPADWDGPGAALISALDLPFETRPAASEEALVATLVEASTASRPALAMFWVPHWAVAAHDLRFIDLPVAEALCHEDPAWGPNPQATGDCGFPSLGTVKAIVRGFKTRWPAAYLLLQDFQVDNATHASLMIEVERDNRPLPEVAAGWATAQQERLRPMIEAATD